MSTALPYLAVDGSHVEDLMNVHDRSLRKALGQGRTLPAEWYTETMPEKEQRAMVDFIDQVQREDIIIVESVQRGLRSGFYKQGQLILSRENGIQHFQKLVFSALTD